MPRMARLVVPDYPHHITQRGSRRQRTFFGDEDYQAYIDLLCELKADAGVDIWAYCLMPNHLHLVAVPQRKESLAILLRVTHHRYALRVNAMHGWQGHLWQERFFSTVMDDAHLLAAVRYVELNPVRAGLCKRADDWRWSSVHAHLNDAPDNLVTTFVMRDRICDWYKYLSEDSSPEQLESLRQSTKTGRPVGSDEFVGRLEDLTGRRLRRQKPGRKPAQ